MTFSLIINTQATIQDLSEIFSGGKNQDPGIIYLELEEPVIVTGSSSFQFESKYYAVIRRNTGGGAVLVSKDDSCFLQISVDHVPGDPRFSSPKQSFLFISKLLRRAISKQINTALYVWQKEFLMSPRSDIFLGDCLFPIGKYLCFGSRSPGELLVYSETGPKVVGIAQRRTKSSITFQVGILRSFVPEVQLKLLEAQVGPLDHETLLPHLAELAAPLDIDFVQLAEEVYFMLNNPDNVDP